MNYNDFKKLGVDGVYRADLDEWFPVGQEPPVTVNPPTLLTPAADAKPESVAVEVAKPEPKVKAKADKGD